MSKYKLVPAEPTPNVSESKTPTTKESWWAGYRAGKGLPANTPRQDAIAAPDVALLLTLLELAQCPNCDGSGGFYDRYGQLQQCQWCHERAETCRHKQFVPIA